MTTAESDVQHPSSDRPEPGFYYHYKHDPAGPVNEYAYEFLGVARHSEDENALFVMYRPLYESSYFADIDASIRPLPMFMDAVEKDGVKVPRFSRVTDPAVIKELEHIRARMYRS